MAHKDQLDFFKNFSEISKILGRTLRIVEIGSLDINGTIRNMYCGENHVEEYVGVDIGEGQGVDIVEQGHKFLSKNKGKFNLILSAECLEHNPYWRETIAEAINSLDSPGMLIFSWATTGRHVHGTHSQSAHSAPFVVEQWNSYYHNVSLSELLSVKERAQLAMEVAYLNFYHKDLYWVGLKLKDKQLGKNQLEALHLLIKSQQVRVNQINNQFCNDYKYLLHKALRSKTEGLIGRLNPKYLDSRLGSFLRKRSKNAFTNSRVVFPLLLKRKKRLIKRYEFTLHSKIAS
jgi:SAM-dependent methyltransferase